MATELEARGLRNNNPGNIRRSADNWQGLAVEQTDPDFFQFATPFFGLRALGTVLKNYKLKYGLRTPRQIIGRWAPSSENDTEIYIEEVDATLAKLEGKGIAPDDAIDTADPDELADLMQAIVFHEDGSEPYPRLLVAQAASSALGLAG